MKKLYPLLVFLVVISLAGCFSTAQEDPPGSSTVKSPGDEQSIARSTSSDRGEPTASETITGETTTVVLYFGDNQGELVPERRTVPKVTGIARETLQELCAGPEKKELTPTIPAGTQLLDINIKDGLCVADFSRELAEKHPGGSAGERLTVYSIVNTLTQFPTVEKVRIRLEGQEVNTLAGHVDLNMPLQRNSSILNG